MEHPIDELHEIRREIRRLRRKERIICEQLLNGDISNRGAHYTAHVTRRVELRPVELPPRTFDVD